MARGSVQYKNCGCGPPAELSCSPNCVFNSYMTLGNLFKLLGLALTMGFSELGIASPSEKATGSIPGQGTCQG